MTAGLLRAWGGLALLLALAAPGALAASSKWADEREIYREAVRLIKTGQFDLYYHIKRSLRDYPLYDYLRYTELIHRLERFNKSEMVDYLEEFKGRPVALSLRQHWLRHLADQEDWRTFADYYSPEVADKELACLYGRSLQKTGREGQLMQWAQRMWLAPQSQPDACNPVFHRWRELGGMTSELAWQRFELAIKSGEFKLAKYLRTLLAEDDQPYAEPLKKIQQRPEYILQTDRFWDDTPRMQDIILYGVVALSRYRAQEAFNVLKQYQRTHDFDEAALEAAWVEVGIMLSLTSQAPVPAKSLPAKPHKHPRLMEAQLRNALRQEDWQRLPKQIAQLPAELQGTPRWRYWTARGLAASDAGAEQARAEDSFAALAQERNFYGFLSAELLGQDYSFLNETRDPPEWDVTAVAEKPGLERALELFALGERTLARMEWYAASSKLSAAEAEAAAVLALRHGWRKAAIQTLIDAEAWNVLDSRFPLAYESLFNHLSQRARIPLAWGLAIARQESAFMPDAKSPSGALGIMQIMPATARQLASKTKFGFSRNSSLLELSRNIALGVEYLGQLLRRFDNNRVLASAAYNAGPNRVEDWAQSWLAPSLPVDVWVEAIPYTETRNYVQSVLTFSSIYSYRMDEPRPLFREHEKAAFGELRLVSSPASGRGGEDI